MSDASQDLLITTLLKSWRLRHLNQSFTLRRLIDVAENDGEGNGLLDNLTTFVGGNLSARKLAQFLSKILDKEYDGFVLTVSHVSGNTSYYHVLSKDEYELVYTRPLESLDARELMARSTIARGKHKINSILEYKKKTDGVTVGPDECIDGNEGSPIVRLPRPEGAFRYRKFDPFGDDPWQIVGVVHAETTAKKDNLEFQATVINFTIALFIFTIAALYIIS